MKFFIYGIAFMSMVRLSLAFFMLESYVGIICQISNFSEDGI